MSNAEGILEAGYGDNKNFGPLLFGHCDLVIH